MKAVLKYPGAKNRIAAWICSFIPEHDVYLEPYFGSGAVFFNKQRAKRIETINDINDDVYNFFKVLRDNSDELIKLLSLTPYSRIEYNKAYVDSDDSIEQARRFCVRCWQGFGCANRYRNGFKSGQQSQSPNPAKAWKVLPNTLIEATERLKDTQIEHLDAIELLNRYDTSDVFIYADPPYLLGTRKGYLYKHEMSDKDHIELLNTLKKHPGKILISGYDNDLYDSILVGWHKEYKQTTAEHGLQRIECLWMNYKIQQTLF